MKILLIEPYYTGSHKQWVDGYEKHSAHEIRSLTLKGQFWKWRMHGGAVTLANEFNQMQWNPDLILATDMLDLTTFLSLTRKRSNGIPTAIYFHENQLSYPWSPDDRDIQNKRDSHYGFINYSSALAANKIFFNSKFHMNSFLDALHPFLRQFPDHQGLETIGKIKERSHMLYLGMDLKILDDHKTNNDNGPIILWNHRWEYDKNPELFFETIGQVKNSGQDFKLVVLGENFSQSPGVFEQSKKIFKDNIIHWGYAESFDQYAEWLWRADILPVTSKQEFFGASVMEAIYCGAWPILPNRLTYPELIPLKQHPDNFYNDPNELYEKVICALKNYKKVRENRLDTLAQQYNWETMAPIYDRELNLI